MESPGPRKEPAVSSKSAAKPPDQAEAVRDAAGRTGDGVVAFEIDAALLVGVRSLASPGNAFTTLKPASREPMWVTPWLPRSPAA